MLQNPDMKKKAKNQNIHRTIRREDSNVNVLRFFQVAVEERGRISGRILMPVTQAFVPSPEVATKRPGRAGTADTSYDADARYLTLARGDI